MSRYIYSQFSNGMMGIANTLFASFSQPIAELAECVYRPLNTLTAFISQEQVVSAEEKLAARLKLTASDVCELCGIPEAFGTRVYLTSGEEVRTHLDEVQKDIEDLAAYLVGTFTEQKTRLLVFRSTPDLRQEFGEWSGCANAVGPFAGPHSQAVLLAYAKLVRLGHEPSIEIFNRFGANTVFVE